MEASRTADENNLALFRAFDDFFLKYARDGYGSCAAYAVLRRRPT